MNMPKPSIGRIVHYALNEHDAKSTNKRRDDAHKSAIAATNSGAQVHYGSTAHEGEVLPAIITYVHSVMSINAQVFLEGNDTLWITARPLYDDSVDEGSEVSPLPGYWCWPPRV